MPDAHGVRGGAQVGCDVWGVRTHVHGARPDGGPVPGRAQRRKRKRDRLEAVGDPRGVPQPVRQGRAHRQRRVVPLRKVRGFDAGQDETDGGAPSSPRARAADKKVRDQLHGQGRVDEGRVEEERSWERGLRRHRS